MRGGDTTFATGTPRPVRMHTLLTPRTVLLIAGELIIARTAASPAAAMAAAIAAAAALRLLSVSGIMRCRMLLALPFVVASLTARLVAAARRPV